MPFNFLAGQRPSEAFPVFLPCFFRLPESVPSLPGAQNQEPPSVDFLFLYLFQCITKHLKQSSFGFNVSPCITPRIFKILYFFI